MPGRQSIALGGAIDCEIGLRCGKSKPCVRRMRNFGGLRAEYLG